MWRRKTWTLKQRVAYEAWIAANENRCQIVTVFVNNGYGVQYRRLLVIY